MILVGLNPVKAQQNDSCWTGSGKTACAHTTLMEIVRYVEQWNVAAFPDGYIIRFDGLSDVPDVGAERRAVVLPHHIFHDNPILGTVSQRKAIIHQVPQANVNLQVLFCPDLQKIIYLACYI